ncbi:MAG: M56 family metallopeptidase [Eubacteriales bacterium]|nr:M56 family metallopeptidase [Eubacteriales bacterium]
MTDLFFRVLNLSISASYLVLAVAGLRLVLKKAPRWVWPLLWGLVALRLLVPVSIESRMSMVPDPAPVSRAAVAAYAPPVTVKAAADRQVNAANASQNRPVEVRTEPAADDILAMVWLAGAAGMALYTAGSYASLRRRVGRARQVERGIFESQNVASPFVLGLVRPRIYLPVGLGEPDRGYILAHERAHIRRLDHLWKPLGFFLLAVHWFNPVLWLAYVLLCRDIELACDERVIRTLGREGRADYSQALLTCAVRRRSIAACPLAFGEVGVKQRVKSVLSYKKPAFWVVLAAVIASVVVSVCFLTNPETAEKGRLTLDAVRELAQKDGPISMEDLDGYAHLDDGFNSKPFGSKVDFYDVTGNLYIYAYPQQKYTKGQCGIQLHCKHDSAVLNLQEHPEHLEEFLELHDRPLDEGWDNHWKLSLGCTDLSPTGAEVYLNQYGYSENYQLSFDENYTIWKKDDRKSWVELPSKTASEAGQRSLPSGQYEQVLDWTERYGVLPDGEYRLTKRAYFDSFGTDISAQVPVEFRISVDGKPQLTVAEFLNRKKFEDNEAYLRTADREAYKTAHRNGWADYEDFAYVEDVSMPGWTHRAFLLENGLVMSMNGDTSKPRPYNMGLSNGIDGEWVDMNGMESREALAFALDLFSQPLAPGAQDHIGVALTVNACSPTGATVSFVGTPPDHVVIKPYKTCYLSKLDDSGLWQEMPDVDGEVSRSSGFPWDMPAAQTFDWTEQYGPLDPGTYRINVDTQVSYESGGELTYLGLIYWKLSAPFTVGESQTEALAAQAKPFEPGEVHDLTQAVLYIRDAEYVLTDRDSLAYLESLLSQARPEKGAPGCPFNSTAYLVRADGAVFSFRHAEDSCQAIEAGDSYYAYDLGLGRDFWDTFGLVQNFVETTYDDQGQVVQTDEYQWGLRVPDSTTKFRYDEAGNLHIKERLNDDGTTRRKEIYEYDSRGSQIAWWSYDGNTLWTRGQREFDEQGNVVQETSYRGDVLYLGTAYVYDENGRILEKISTLEGQPAGTARYEWSDDHHYRVSHLDTNENLLYSTAYVTDDEDRVIRWEQFTKDGVSEGWEEYEYAEGNDRQMIVRCYDKTGTLTEEGWRNID